MTGASQARREGVPAWAALALALLVTGIAFASTLQALWGDANTTNPRGLLGLAQLTVLVCIVLTIRRRGAPEAPRLEPSMLGAVPLLCASLLLTVFGPTRLDFAYWYLRFDVAAMLAFALAAIVLAVGVRASIGSVPILVLVVCAVPVVLLPLLEVLQAGAGWIVRSVAAGLSEALPMGATHLGSGVFDVGGDRRVSIASECSGIESATAALLFGAVVVAGTSGRRRAMVAVVAVGVLLSVVLNSARVVTLVALAGHEQEAAFDAVHGWGGTVAIVVTVLAMLAAARAAGLRWADGSLRSRINYASTYRAWSAVALLVALGVVVVAQREQDVVLRAREAYAGAVQVRAQVREDGTSTGSLELPVDGYDVRTDEEYRWFRRYFGPQSHATSFTLVRTGAQEEPVWAQVIVARSRRKLDQYGPVDCFIAHGARIYRVRKVPLEGGSGTLVQQRQQRAYFSALSFTQPVLDPSGERAWRRVVLFAIAPERRDGDGGRGDGTRVARPRGPVEQFAYSLVNALSPMPSRDLPVERDYADASERVTRAALAILREREA